MPVADQRHALDVVARLRAAGLTDPDLLAAALLHDAGKGPRVRLWHRVVAVLVEAVSDSAMETIGSSEPVVVAASVLPAPPPRGAVGARRARRRLRTTGGRLHRWGAGRSGRAIGGCIAGRGRGILSA